MNLENEIKQASDLIYKKLDDILPRERDNNDLIKAMRYICLSEGKRIRPFLVLNSAKLFAVSQENALRLACAIEVIHSYSLTHDDLPAIDNDDIRRGQDSVHIKFNEATAILAGDALLTYAFEILADPSVTSDAKIRCELISNITKAIGVNGMVGGQLLDVQSENKDLSIAEICRIQRMKTGCLIETSCEAGAILGKASKSMRTALRGYAYAIGLAYQIKDDLQDAKNNNQHGKPTLVSSIGKEKAIEQIKLLQDQAINHLSIFDKKADNLRELAIKITQLN